jgi:hypothetical protein
MQPAGLPRTVQSQRVMPGLVPGIHAAPGPQFCEIKCRGTAIGIGGSLTAPPLPHHRAYGSVHGDSAD